MTKQLGSSPDLLNQIAKDENDRLAGRHPTPRHRKPGPKKQAGKASKKGTRTVSAAGTAQKAPVKEEKTRKKPGVKPGTKRSDINKDGTPRKRTGVPVGYKHGMYKKDGTLRQKPGPKPKKAN